MTSAIRGAADRPPGAFRVSVDGSALPGDGRSSSLYLHLNFDAIDRLGRATGFEMLITRELLERLATVGGLA